MQCRSKSLSTFSRTSLSVILTYGMMALRPAGAAEPINFNRDIRPILSDRCFACHGPDKNARKADLRLDQRDAAVESDVIKPGHPADSELVKRIFADDEDLLMPPPKHNKPLSVEQKELLKRWIAEGAEYQPHWAFIPVPKEVAVPTPTDPAHWIRNPIDAFVLNRLQQLKLEPAAEASREKWLRRASFDLTGLPPTIAELDAVAYGYGPGSFTGIRIASSVAQGIAYAANIPVIQVSSLAVLAQSAFFDQQWRKLIVATDARMGGGPQRRVRRPPHQGARARDLAAALDRAGLSAQGGRLHGAWRRERPGARRRSARGGGGLDQARISQRPSRTPRDCRRICALSRRSLR